MGDRNKVERRVRENYDIYKEINGEENHGRPWPLAWLQAAIKLHPACFLGGTAIAALAYKGVPSTELYVAITVICVCSLIAIVLTAGSARGKYAETGKQRGQGPAQSGSARASTRQA